MLGLLKVRRGRKAAVALIAPLVEQSRRSLPDIPDERWLDPYMVGFMGMLISLVAERATGGLSSHAAGLVQAEAWGDITGCARELIGPEICLLSSGEDRLFGDGCRNAARLMQALEQVNPRVEPDRIPAGYASHGMDFDPATATALWSEYFEARMRA